MNRHSLVYVVRKVALALGMVVVLQAPAQAQSAGCPSHLSTLQMRLLTQAYQGPAAVRRFIDIRRPILMLDIGETQAWTQAVLERCPAIQALAAQAAGAGEPVAAASATVSH